MSKYIVKYGEIEAETLYIDGCTLLPIQLPITIHVMLPYSIDSPLLFMPAYMATEMKMLKISLKI